MGGRWSVVCCTGAEHISLMEEEEEKEEGEREREDEE